MSETSDSAGSGMRAFYVVWLGQLVSITGTVLTAFGLQLFVFGETGSVTSLSLVAVAFAVPGVLLAPLAGSVADRFDRRMVMLLADVVAATATMGLLAVYAADALELWHIYVATAVGSAANAFQEPAWLASIPVLVPKKRLGRANGLVQLNQGLSIVLAPALAGLLLATVGLGAVLVVDVASFLVGIATLAAVRFPPYVASVEHGSSVVDDARAAWRYLRRRPGLFGLLWLYSGVNFMLAISNVLLIPLIVSFADEAAAGAILSAAGFGAIVGSVVVGAWGGPKRRIRGILIGIVFSGLAVAGAGVRASVPFIAVSAVLLMLIVPVVNVASQIIWQTKVDEGVQGRVFSLRRMIAQGVAPVAILLSGPLADGVFEPLLEPGGGLASSVGRLIGTGPGRGIGFLYLVAGVGTALIAVAGWLMPRVRNLEHELPDVAGHD